MIGAWADLATTDFADLDPDRAVAILPVAATEQHGPHLPLGTDAMINQGVLDQALGLLDPSLWVAVLPAQHVGESLEHIGFPGTLSLSAETALAVWNAIGAGVSRAGVRKLILFNSHGGQTGLVDTVAVRLRQAHGLLTVRASTFALGLPGGVVPPDEAEHGLHGGLVETAVMLALHPGLVRMDQAGDFASAGIALARDHQVLRAEGPVGLGWAAEDLHPAGPTGNAAAATAALGTRILDHWADRLAVLIGEVATLPPSTLPLPTLPPPPSS